jgi:hypothetical protein
VVLRRRLPEVLDAAAPWAGPIWDLSSAWRPAAAWWRLEARLGAVASRAMVGGAERFLRRVDGGLVLAGAGSSVARSWAAKEVSMLAVIFGFLSR